MEDSGHVMYRSAPVSVIGVLEVATSLAGVSVVKAVAEEVPVMGVLVEGVSVLEVFVVRISLVVEPALEDWDFVAGVQIVSQGGLGRI